MKKFTKQQIESFSGSNRSRKSWLNKVYDFVQTQNLWDLSYEQVMARMNSQGFITNPATYSAIKSTFKNFLNNLESQKTQEIEEISPSPQTQESSEKLSESLRQKQELLKIQAEQLAKTQQEAQEEAKRLEEQKIKEAKERAEAEAKRLQEAQELRQKALRAGFESEEIPDEFLKWNPSDFTVHFANEYYQQTNEKDQMYALLDNGFNVILSGDAGTGKSELAMKYAHDRKDPFFKISCSADMRKNDLIGSKTIDENQQIKNIAGMLTKAVLTANKTGSVTVLLDEGNALIQKVQILLYGLTDKTRRIDLPEMKKPLKLNKGAIMKFIITMNDMYSGVNPLNKPLLDRFEVIKMQPLKKEIVLKILDSYNIDSKTKEGIYQLGLRIRQLQQQNNLSEQALFTTRSQKATCQKIEIYNTMKISNPIQTALESSIVQKFSEENYQKIIRDEIKAIFS